MGGVIIILVGGGLFIIVVVVGIDFIRLYVLWGVVLQGNILQDDNILQADNKNN